MSSRNEPLSGQESFSSNLRYRTQGGFLAVEHPETLKLVGAATATVLEAYC